MKKINKKLVKETVTNLFESILSGSQKEALEKFPELSKSLSDIMTKSPEDFHLDVYYPLDNIIRASISNDLKKSPWDKDCSNVVFIYENYTFIESNIQKFIEIREGHACEADKSRWLVSALARYYGKGEKIDMRIGKKCYWKPHFWTNKQWIGLFEALHHLYYGNHSEYMLFLQKNWLPLLMETKKDAVLVQRPKSR
jgi:hypothetical protein